MPKETIRAEVENALLTIQVDDIHTHLYSSAFGDLLLWGIDDLLTYHYLVAESFRYLTIPYDSFWSLPKPTQAEMIWNELFIKHSPISESCRGVITTLNKLGFDVKRRDLGAVRQWYQNWKTQDYVNHVLDLANVKSVWMTNSPFDPIERKTWDSKAALDPRFKTALRIDPLLLNWADTALRLVHMGYNVGEGLSTSVILQVRKFLKDWTDKIGADYLMVSLPPDFVYPCHSETTQLIEEAVIPHCIERNLPFALMPGVLRGVNPGLKLAGDGMGRNDLSFLRNLCSQHSRCKFMVTALSRENQHELCVIARKFRNLHLFGCWWFTNTPSMVDEITRTRLELLGTSFTAQHSDARVLDQLIYKWGHTREILSATLSDHYIRLADSGWEVSSENIERDIRWLTGEGFREFQAREL